MGPVLVTLYQNPLFTFSIHHAYTPCMPHTFHYAHHHPTPSVYPLSKLLLVNHENSHPWLASSPPQLPPPYVLCPPWHPMPSNAYHSPHSSIPYLYPLLLCSNQSPKLHLHIVKSNRFWPNNHQKIYTSIASLRLHKSTHSFPPPIHCQALTKLLYLLLLKPYNLAHSEQAHRLLGFLNISFVALQNPVCWAHYSVLHQDFTILD